MIERCNNTYKYMYRQDVQSLKKKKKKKKN